jgi:hypothetical protein
MEENKKDNNKEEPKTREQKVLGELDNEFKPMG